MALETFVKVSKVNNLSDARYCAGMGVDVIGFNLVPGSPDYMAPEKYKEITEWLAGVEFAGEFKGLASEDILKQLEHYNLQFIQIEDPSLIGPLAKKNIPIIFKVDFNYAVDLRQLRLTLEKNKAEVKYFLFESEFEHYDPDQQLALLALAKNYPVILGYGVNSQNVVDLIRGTSIHGIALLGENEIQAGLKDFDKLADVLEIIEVDEFAD